MLQNESIYDENKQMIVYTSNRVKSSGVFNSNIEVIMELNCWKAKSEKTCQSAAKIYILTTCPLYTIIIACLIKDKLC